MRAPAFYSALAKSILAGEAVRDKIVRRLAATLGHNWRWLSPLVRRYLTEFGASTRARSRTVARFLRADAGLARALDRYGDRIRIAAWMGEPAVMRPAQAARRWPIPPIESVGALADWLEVEPLELEWLADLKRRMARGNLSAESKLTHYHYRILPKEGGAIRVIESPKKRLKLVQSKILTGILEQIPVHPAAHGFRRGRSVKTFAAPHVRQDVVLRMDLRDFFPSFSAPRVQAMFRTAGYPEKVADLLGGLCTNAVPRALWTKTSPVAEMAAARHLYAWPHLPQGAPSSPALANICSHRIDARLTGLAESCGAVYTRYADDLAFSGDAKFERSVERFSIRVGAILLEEGFTVHHRKTRVMRRGVRQYLAGIVTNRHLNVVRRDFDLLKATLNNCVRHGAGSQNREQVVNFRAHLDGRVSFVEMVNPRRGKKLRQIYGRIVW